MKPFLHVIIYLIVLFLFESSAYSLSDNQIIKPCQENQRRSTCKKNYKFKKSNLLKGNRIEIPVIPFKNK